MLNSYAARICGEDYLAMERQLKSIARKFVLRYGGDFDETFAEASYQFAVCWQTYDDSKGAALSSWLHSRIRWALLDRLKKSMHRHKIAPCEALGDTDVAEEEHVGGLESVDEDVLTVVRLVRQPPKQLKQLYKASEYKERFGWRRALRAYLKQELNWDAEHVNRVFSQLKEAL